jgi:hypothetical protein
MNFVKIFADDRRLEENGFPNFEQGDFAQGRKAQEPVRLILQVDVGNVVLDLFLIQQDDRPLDIWSEYEADQFRFFGHAPSFSPRTLL